MVDVLQWLTDGYGARYVRVAMDRDSSGNLHWCEWLAPVNVFVP